MGVSDLEVAPCAASDRGEALALLYQRHDPDARGGWIADVLADSESGKLDLSGLWLARRAGTVVGTLFTLALAGRAVAVWPPEVSAVWRRGAIAGELIRTALADLKGRGYAFAQAVLDEETPLRRRADLTRGGMPHVTDLSHLVRDARAPLDAPGGPRLAWRGLDEAGEDVFEKLLPATYVGSLDLPELNGVRSMADVVVGHRAAEGFSPERWRLGWAPGEADPCALVLLAASEDRDAWEVVYLGVRADVRGRGFGMQALSHGLGLAAAHASRVELAVDVRNHPAARLYRAAGFVPYARSRLHLAVLGERIHGARP